MSRPSPTPFFDLTLILYICKRIAVSLEGKWALENRQANVAYTSDSYSYGSDGSADEQLMWT